MKELFWDVTPLDTLARDKYEISEDLMMEHAALAIKEQIEKRCDKTAKILIATGSGNNGADGYALARVLYDYDVEIFEVLQAKTPLCKLQKSRSDLCGVKLVKTPLLDYDIIIDTVFGSGLQNNIDEKLLNTVKLLNSLSGYKIACDFPSGLNKDGTVQKEVFKADATITMGAGKLGLFSDFAKEFVGEVVIANLGISKKHYLQNSMPNGYLLETSDLKLPFRQAKSSHKGTYGHVAVFVGDKTGAGILCGISALSFGAGLTTLVSKENLNAPADLMYSRNIPQNANVICLGSGLGNVLSENEIIETSKITSSFLIDADMFYKYTILEFLDKACVLTPHPKEFASLLKLCSMGEFSIEEIQNARFDLAKKFSSKYENIVLVLKGANTIIAHKSELFVCSLGSVSLAKGGSGDVLSGMIGALLAQGYTPMDAATNGVLAHALASQNIKNNYALTPSAFIENIKTL